MGSGGGSQGEDSPETGKLGSAQPFNNSDYHSQTDVLSTQTIRLRESDSHWGARTPIPLIAPTHPRTPLPAGASTPGCLEPWLTWLRTHR